MSKNATQLCVAYCNVRLNRIKNECRIVFNDYMPCEAYGKENVRQIHAFKHLLPMLRSNHLQSG